MAILAILASGMVTGVGLSAPASCAAIRCGISNFQETRFMGQDGEWIMGSMVPLEQPWRGLAKMTHLVVPAIQECLAGVTFPRDGQLLLLLCVSETERPGRLDGLNDKLFEEVSSRLDLPIHEKSAIIPRGRVGGAIAIQFAMEVMAKEQIPFCVVAGVDTFLVGSTLAAYEEKMRLLTTENSNGFTPGEAGTAILLAPALGSKPGALLVQGVGFGLEKATIEAEEPLRADGLVEAIKKALAMAGMTMGDLDFRITDANGEQYLFKEAALALSRTLRTRKEEFDIWHLADCLGEIGAATVPAALAVALAAAEKDYAPGKRMLCHFGNDGGRRAAVIVTSD
jgi:3-oxoacyl-[acyl-carrier-protein] synthase-1